jgi:hypothetical protein
VRFDYIHNASRIPRFGLTRYTRIAIFLNMNASAFSQGVGLLACVGVIGLIGAIAVVARVISSQRGRPMEPNNSAVQPLSAPPFEDGGFGGVPTTGPVQEYERDYHPQQIIGSSGFEEQRYEDEAGEEAED